MSDESDIKQRGKHLATFSASFAVINLLGIELNKIQLLGNEAAVSNPSILSIALWSVWFYLVYNFWVHARSVRPSVYAMNRDNAIFHAIRTIAHARIIAQVKNSETFQADWPNVTKVGLENMNGERLERLGLRIRYNYSGHLHWEDPDGQRNQVDLQQHVDLNTFESMKVAITCELWEQFGTPHFTTFLLPYAISMTPVIVLVVKRFLLD